MNEHDMMYEGDGILRKPNRWDRIAAYERRARRLRAIYIGGLFARLLDWLESKARAAWRRRAEHVRIGPGLFVALDAKTVDRIIEAEATHARFFAGLVAWQPGELREKLERGLWYVLEPETELVMRKPTDGLWEELVNRSERRANTI